MQPLTRQILRQRILDATERDPRLVGLLDYGSASEGRADALSDVDLALFVRDEALANFRAQWATWAGQFGDLLLAYTSGVGHPWTVYDASPVPLRADFNFWPQSQLAGVTTWPNAPTSVEAMVLYDETNGALSAHVATLVGQSLRPADLHATFDQVCGDFWYYTLRTLAKFWRDERWSARFELNFIMTGNLAALLRIEAALLGHEHALDRWSAQQAVAGIERVISPQRLAALDGSIPGPNVDDLAAAFAPTTALAHSVCTAIHAITSWPWPRELANRACGLAAAPRKLNPFGQEGYHRQQF